MSRIEDELRIELARREPPAGFADRVMARVPPARRRVWREHSWMAAAAAVLVSILGGSAYEYQRTQKMRQQGEMARAELVFALELASEKLQQTRAKVLKNSEGRL